VVTFVNLIPTVFVHDALAYAITIPSSSGEAGDANTAAEVVAPATVKVRERVEPPAILGRSITVVVSIMLLRGVPELPSLKVPATSRVAEGVDVAIPNCRLAWPRLFA
jgi:hypothetical protein